MEHGDHDHYRGHLGPAESHSQISIHVSRHDGTTIVFGIHTSSLRHEGAHLVYFGFAGVTNYKAFPARITYDPKVDDFVGSLASVQILDIPKIKGRKFWDQMFKVACAYAAGGVIARKLMPSSDGGDEHDKERFESLCAELKSKHTNFSIDVLDFWKKAQDCVAKGLENAEWLSKIQEFAETLQPELGL